MELAVKATSNSSRSRDEEVDLQWLVEADFYAYLATANDRVQGIEDDSEASLRGAITAVLLAGVSQAEIAERIKVSRPTLSRWSKGEHMPRAIVRKAYLGEIKSYLSQLTREVRKKLEESPRRPPDRVIAKYRLAEARV